MITIKKGLIIFILFTFVCNYTFSQSKIDDYEYSCYCVLRFNPESLIKEGNNWELLNALQSWKTLDELRTNNIKYAEKQIEVLTASNFIEKQDNKYKSIVTILNNEKSVELRKKTKEISKEIVQNILPDFVLLSKELKNKNFENSTYTMLFSYVMDNIIWRKLEDNNILKTLDLNIEKPFWDGTLWFNSKRANSCGTNSVIDDKLIVAINHTPNSFFSQIDEIVDYDKMLKDLKMYNFIKDTSLISILKNYNICDKNGYLKVPFIKKDSLNNLVTYSNNIADKIYKYLITDVDFDGINKQFNFNSKSDAIIIIYHDIMWDILDFLEEQNQIKKPSAFSNPDKNKLTDLRDIFLIYEE